MLQLGGGDVEVVLVVCYGEWGVGSCCCLFRASEDQQSGRKEKNIVGIGLDV